MDKPRPIWDDLRRTAPPAVNVESAACTPAASTPITMGAAWATGSAANGGPSLAELAPAFAG